MDQAEPTDTLRPFPPFTINPDVLKPALSKWVQEIQKKQTDTPYDLIDSSIPIIIFELLQEKRSRICSLFHMKGGWEGWFQAELALCLEKHGYTVDREQHVFKAQLDAADLIVKSPNGVCTIIELKCEGLFQDITGVQMAAPTTRPNFALRMEADMKKFGHGGGNIRDEYRGKFFCCVGVSGTVDSTLEAVYHRPPMNNGRPWFGGMSLDRLALYAEENGLIPDDLDGKWPENLADASSDELLMWWSGVHQVSRNSLEVR